MTTEPTSAYKATLLRRALEPIQRQRSAWQDFYLSLRPSLGTIEDDNRLVMEQLQYTDNMARLEQKEKVIREEVEEQLIRDGLARANIEQAQAEFLDKMNVDGANAGGSKS